MSRTLAALIAFMLGAPVVAFVAIGAAAGMNPSVYAGALGFLAGVLFLMGFAYEVLRIASASSDDLVHGWLPRQKPVPAVDARDDTRPTVDRTQVEVIREQRAVAAPVIPLQGHKAA